MKNKISTTCHFFDRPQIGFFSLPDAVLSAWKFWRLPESSLARARENSAPLMGIQTANSTWNVSAKPRLSVR
jgi:hypothetical protein